VHTKTVRFRVNRLDVDDLSALTWTFFPPSSFSGGSFFRGRFFLVDLFSVGHFSVDVFSVDVISVDLFSYNPKFHISAHSTGLLPQWNSQSQDTTIRVGFGIRVAGHRPILICADFHCCCTVTEPALTDRRTDRQTDVMLVA